MASILFAVIVSIIDYREIFTKNVFSCFPTEPELILFVGDKYLQREKRREQHWGSERRFCQHAESIHGPLKVAKNAL
jgi:hypothetical protein